MNRVCVISNGLPPAFYGGAELRAYRYVQRLHDQHKASVLLVARDQSSSPPVTTVYPPYIKAVKLTFQGASQRGKIAFLLSFIVHISEIFFRVGHIFFRHRKEYDLVHIVNAAPWFNLIAIFVAKLFHKPVLLEMTSLGSDDPLNLSRRERNKSKQVFRHRPLKYRLFLQADHYVSKSEALTQAYHSAQLPASHLTQILSGVDCQKFHPVEDEEKIQLRQKLCLPVEACIILFIGGMYKLKGIHFLLEAFKDIALTHPQAHLVIAGPVTGFDPDYVRELHENVTAWRLADRVSFIHEQISNVETYMQAADIYAHPSTREGFSNVIAEAMASGLPIVTSNIPEIALSQITHGEEGLLTIPGNVAELGKSLAALIDSKSLRLQLGQQARQKVIRNFSQEQTDQQYLALYSSLINK